MMFNIHSGLVLFRLCGLFPFWLSSLWLSVPFTLIIDPTGVGGIFNILPCQICICDRSCISASPLCCPHCVCCLVRLKFLSDQVTLVWLSCKVCLVICVWPQLLLLQILPKFASVACKSRLYQALWNWWSCEHLTRGWTGDFSVDLNSL